MKNKKQNQGFPVLVSGIDGYQNWVRVNEFQHKAKRGDYTNLADRTGYSPSYVWRVMNGERGANPSIISAAHRMVARRKSPFSF
jgi:transcriptional regulator with XRE-family HTH domain